MNKLIKRLIESLFDDIDDNSSKTLDKKNNEKENLVNKDDSVDKKINDLMDMDFDDAPMLPQEQENDDDTYDLQKELEAKFDELFGPLEDDE